MKNKLIQTVIAFILLFPFRLPISVLLIKMFNYFASIGTGDLIPSHVLMGNVVVTKIIYNLLFGAWFLYSIEMGSRQKMGRNPNNEKTKYSWNPTKDQPMYWWTLVTGILFLGFFGYDIYATTQLFPLIK